MGLRGVRRQRRDDHPGSDRQEPGRLEHHGTVVRVHQLRRWQERAVRADLPGGDARQIEGDVDGARAPRRPAGEGSRERMGIRRRQDDPSAAGRHAVQAEPCVRVRLHGQGSRGGGTRARRHARSRLLSTSRGEGRGGQHEPAGWRRAQHVQLLHLTTLAHAQRSACVRLQRRRAGKTRHRRDAQVDRRRQRRSDQLSLRADRTHGAEPAEPSLSGRRVPLRVSRADRSSEREDRRTHRTLPGQQHVPEDLRRQFRE